MACIKCKRNDGKLTPIADNRIARQPVSRNSDEQRRDYMPSIIVTGQPRSGTSLMMQTLKMLGANVVAEPFGAQAPPEDLDRAKRMNPRGYYEMGVIGIDGQWFPRAHGAAVKVMLQPLSRAEQAICPIIYCNRQPTDILYSLSKLHKTKYSAWRYIAPLIEFAEWLTDEAEGRILVVNYDDAIADASAMVDSVARHCGLTPTPQQLTEAENNVAPSLRRHDGGGWTRLPVSDADDIRLADAMHSAIAARQWDQLRIIAAEAKSLYARW